MTFGGEIVASMVQYYVKLGINSVYFCAGLCSLKQPEYQHHRESIGAAKTLDQIEDITAQLKSSLLV